MFNFFKNPLHVTAKELVTNGKGILAADESSKTADKRFEVVGVPTTGEMRRKWRELLFTAPDAEKYLSGVILFDETIRQSSGGVPFPKLLSDKGIIPGIKVDKGLIDMPGFPGEKISDGLDGLENRLAEYSKLGAKFAKWRAVIVIGENMPTKQCLKANAEILSKYAVVCQKAGFVPIVEPEVLLDGTHTIQKCEEVIIETLKVLFATLAEFKVDLKGLILKTSMALPGKSSGQSATAKEVAEATVRALKASVPKEVAGIVFLSGGQTSVQATENLNEIAKVYLNQTEGLVGPRATFPGLARTDLFDKSVLGGKPWPLTFSYSRALQEPVLQAWAGKDENAKMAQEIFRKRMQETSAASLGKYGSGMEQRIN